MIHYQVKNIYKMKELLAVYRTELIKTKNSFAFWEAVK